MPLRAFRLCVRVLVDCYRRNGGVGVGSISTNRARRSYCTPSYLPSRRASPPFGRYQVILCASVTKQYISWYRPSRSCSGFAGGINFQVVHSGLGLTPSFLQRLCEILAFISTLIFSMQVHVQRSVAGCFAVLRQLRSILRFVPSSVYQSLVVALVLSRLDYGNATLAGLPASLLNRLQSVINAAARSIAGLRRSEHYYRCSRQFPLASSARAHQV